MSEETSELSVAKVEESEECADENAIVDRHSELMAVYQDPVTAILPNLPAQTFAQAGLDCEPVIRFSNIFLVEEPASTRPKSPTEFMECPARQSCSSGALTWRHGNTRTPSSCLAPFSAPAPKKLHRLSQLHR